MTNMLVTSYTGRQDQGTDEAIAIRQVYFIGRGRVLLRSESHSRDIEMQQGQLFGEVWHRASFSVRWQKLGVAWLSSMAKAHLGSSRLERLGR